MAAPSSASSISGMQDYLINWNAGPLGVVLRPDLGADMPPVVAQLLPQPSVLKLAGVREGDLLISVNGKKTTRLGYEKVVRLLFKERLPMVLHFRSPLQVPELQRGVSQAIAEEPSSARGRARTSSNATANARASSQQQSRARGRSDADSAVEHKRRDPNAQNLSIESDVSERKKSSRGKSKSKHKSRSGAKAEAEERRLRKQYSVVWERGSLGISFRAYNSKVNVPCVDFISASRGQGRGMDRVCVNDVLIAINGEKTKALGVEKVLRWLHVVEKPVVLRFHASSNRIVNPAGGLLPQLADDEERPRRPTIPTGQPEFEPAPRPPRRNNSVDQPPPHQRTDRRYSDDREYELEPTGARSEGRRYSRDSGTHFEQQPIEEYEPQYQLAASNIEVKERRYSSNSTGAYARGDDGTDGDFRREHLDDEQPQFDLRIDAHIIPHRRPQHSAHEEPNRYSQQQHQQLPSSRSRSSSASRDDLRRQQQHAQLESKAVPPPPVTIPPAVARPRVASRDSLLSNSSHMSFEEAADVVARATGKPREECEFGGVPLLNIKEGTVQAKLMFIYAKACLAKEGSSDDEPASKDPQLPRTPGNPLGRKTHSKYLSYSILQDDAVASNHNPAQKDGDMVAHELETKVEVVGGHGNGVDFKKSGVFGHNLDESFAKMQKDISIQPPVVTPPLSSVGPSSSVSSDAPPSVTTPSVSAAPAEDFISLKDFVVKGDGSLTEQHPTSSSATPVPSTDEGEADKTEEHQEKQVVSTEATDDTVVEPVSEEDKHEEDVPKVIELVEEEVEKLAHAEEDEAEKDPKQHDDDDVASVDSSNERDLAASVASLDDLLDLPLKDGAHDDEEHEEFVDDDEEEENEKKHAHKESMNTSLGMMLDQVQEEEGGETEHRDEPEAHDKPNVHEHEEPKVHGEHEEPVEHGDHEEEEEEFEDGALSNPLVNEMFRNIPDVREVIKDKPALMVLVKKSMIDEIQEILQSLQMELQFERHSTMAVGSTALPLGVSQLGRDTEDQHCYRCGATGELAELDVAGEPRELYCQECWEMFFFSEDRRSPVTRTSKTLAPSEAGRLTADEDALDEALKYSFHDSSITREDMIHPWRYRMGSDSMSSSIRDSNDSSITDRTDEVRRSWPPILFYVNGGKGRRNQHGSVDDGGAPSPRGRRGRLRPRKAVDYVQAAQGLTKDDADDENYVEDGGDEDDDDDDAMDDLVEEEDVVDVEEAKDGTVQSGDVESKCYGDDDAMEVEDRDKQLPEREDPIRHASSRSSQNENMERSPADNQSAPSSSKLESKFPQEALRGLGDIADELKKYQDKHLVLYRVRNPQTREKHNNILGL
ncbi:PDZ domain [Phytophthora cinnamomi]|uniref:PDZ domain n=1 Tax=Phytophthora cinnamomi TaxID=4785 RepID=UPI00355A4F84|nr:PDZ domain [Phytophthora cinnamomi]